MQPLSHVFGGQGSLIVHGSTFISIRSSLVIFVQISRGIVQYRMFSFMLQGELHLFDGILHMNRLFSSIFVQSQGVAAASRALPTLPWTSADMRLVNTFFAALQWAICGRGPGRCLPMPGESARVTSGAQKGRTTTYPANQSGET